MFRKQYKVKNSTTVKNSDRKKLRATVESSFPLLSTENLNLLLPIKGELTQVKAETHSGEHVLVYSSGDDPAFFEAAGRCLPSVYTLWRCPSPFLPTLVTAPCVLERIMGGADLMAPGVVVTEAARAEMEGLEAGRACAVRVEGNGCPVAVGLAMMGGEELCVEGVKGKAVAVYHTYRDALWQAGSRGELPTRPEGAPVEEPTARTVEVDSEEKEANPAAELGVAGLSIDDDLTEPAATATDYTMDEVLHLSFLTAVKVHGRKIELPILTSTFYSSYVLKVCPIQLGLDIKKTSHKKLSTFLKKMVKEGLIQIKEFTKGVESIVSFNMEAEAVSNFHLEPLFVEHLKSEKNSTDESQVSKEVYTFPVVTELLVVSAQVRPLFEKYNYKKGDFVSGSTVRDVIKQYVKDNSLQSEKNPKHVVLDPILCDCIVTKGEDRTVLTWEELHNVLVGRMPPAYQIEYSDKHCVTKKGKLDPISVAVEMRTANKKVTLVRNLETYGVCVERLARRVQVAAAASTSVLPGQGSGSVLLIQGNQAKYLRALFLDTFKIPRKYLHGLDQVKK